MPKNGEPQFVSLFWRLILQNGEPQIVPHFFIQHKNHTDFHSLLPWHDDCNIIQTNMTKLVVDWSLSFLIRTRPTASSFLPPRYPAATLHRTNKSSICPSGRILPTSPGRHISRDARTHSSSHHTRSSTRWLCLLLCTKLRIWRHTLLALGQNLFNRANFI